MKKTSVFSNGLIWFGAGVSIAEILIGMYIAPLGFKKGILAIVLGHLIGGFLMYFAGIIGAKTEKSAMETVKMSFGEKGSLLFSSLNVLQLVGWTAVMILSGATVSNSIIQLGGIWFWSLIIGGFIIVWILVGIQNLGKINIVAMGGLFILTIIMSSVIFKGNAIVKINDSISFGAAVELAVAMPLSWLPLISDYTRHAKKKNVSTITSVFVYFLVSCWMYIIGMGATIITGEYDIARIMLTAGLGSVALIIVVLSTVTTTFLDVYSAGVSSVSISKNISEKWASIVVCIIGTILAIFTPVAQFENFLYLIGSVFAPMIAIQIADFFILKHDSSNLDVKWTNFLLWAVGFGIYRVFMKIDTPVGNTLPVMIIVIVLCVVSSNVKQKFVSLNKED